MSDMTLSLRPELGVRCEDLSVSFDEVIMLEMMRASSASAVMSLYRYFFTARIL